MDGNEPFTVPLCRHMLFLSVSTMLPTQKVTFSPNFSKRATVTLLVCGIYQQSTRLFSFTPRPSSYFIYSSNIFSQSLNTRLSHGQLRRASCARALRLKRVGLLTHTFQTTHSALVNIPICQMTVALSYSDPSTSLIPDFSVQRRRTLWYFGGLHTVTS